ncbi:DUF559 domain-containing protein [Microbacterium sp. PA5]|uniref:DUF559 domain-containing protein n=1 Tax=Microbacterium sp. PA5 TaxID=3416654 RepID=UPI003CF65C33
MDLNAWVAARGGIVHRSDILDRGMSAPALRRAIADGAVLRVRRYWVAVPDAPPQLVAAAEATARLACVSAARHRGWWMPPEVDDRLHLHVRPHAEGAREAGVVRHWTVPIGALHSRLLVESVEDTLQHLADCQPRETALVLWEDAARSENLPADVLRRVAWRSPRARELASVLTGLMGSGLETVFVDRLRRWDVTVRVQVGLAGHDVDAVIDGWLVVQLDGFRYHSSSAERTRDLAHDRELVARGYTVLRFSYSEVVYGWDRVEHAIARALAQRRRA